LQWRGVGEGGSAVVGEPGVRRCGDGAADAGETGGVAVASWAEVL